jgi:L-ascorbate metabolism protein UlaG (beta-lactamase superfamily)
MKIKWLGHSAFLITSADNIKIITDPYTPGNGINYRPINESSDIVTVSHRHSDHNNAAAVKGTPVILREKGLRVVKGVEIKGVPVYHDGTLGSQRGGDLVFCFKMDGISLCHTGDLGHALSPRQIEEIGPVDVLMLPVGGFYTIDAKEATAVVQSLKPHIVIPMHYKTAGAEYPIAGLQPFLKDRQNVRQVDSDEIEISPTELPHGTETIVLKSAN